MKIRRFTWEQQNYGFAMMLVREIHCWKFNLTLGKNLWIFTFLIKENRNK